MSAATLPLPGMDLGRADDPSPRHDVAAEGNLSICWGVLSLRDVPAVGKVVANVLEQYLKGKPACWVKNARLGRDGGLTYHDVRRGLKALVDAGLVANMTLRRYRDWIGRMGPAAAAAMNVPAPGMNVRRVLVALWRMPDDLADLGGHGPPTVDPTTRPERPKAPPKSCPASTTARSGANSTARSGARQELIGKGEGSLRGIPESLSLAHPESGRLPAPAGSGAGELGSDQRQRPGPTAGPSPPPSAPVPPRAPDPRLEPGAAPGPPSPTVGGGGPDPPGPPGALSAAQRATVAKLRADGRPLALALADKIVAAAASPPPRPIGPAALTGAEQARLAALDPTAREEVTAWLAAGDPVCQAEALKRLNPDPPPPDPPPEATTLDLIGMLPGRPDLVQTATRALMLEVGDRQRSWPFWAGRCQMVAARARPPDSLAEPLGKLLTRPARPAKTARYLTTSVQRWDRENGFGAQETGRRASLRKPPDGRRKDHP